VVADLNDIHRMNQQQGSMYGGGGGGGIPQMHSPPGWGNPMGGVGWQQPPYGQLEGGQAFGQMGGGGGGGGGGSPGRGNDGMGMGMGGGPPIPVNQPLGKFRSGNPYATPGEMDSKQQQRMELQEALERQVCNLMICNILVLCKCYQDLRPFSCCMCVVDECSAGSVRYHDISLRHLL